MNSSSIVNTVSIVVLDTSGSRSPIHDDLTVGVDVWRLAVVRCHRQRRYRRQLSFKTFDRGVETNTETCDEQVSYQHQLHGGRDHVCVIEVGKASSRDR